HVIPSREYLEVSYFGGVKLNSSIKSGYFRPSTLGDYPDLMFANSSFDLSEKGLSLHFSRSTALEETHLFYIDVYDEDDPIKYLQPLVTKDECGLSSYKQENGLVPRQGISGSPVVEARLLYMNSSSEPIWEFRVVGVIFAIQNATSNLYATPLHSDLEQIRSILYSEASSIRFAQSATATENIGGSGSIFQARSSLELAKRDKDLDLYSSGTCDHSITLPEGMSPLLGTTIVTFGESLFFLKDKWNEYDDALKNYEKLKFLDDARREKLTEAHLYIEFENELLAQLPDDEEVSLKSIESGVFKSKRLRIDFDGIRDVRGCRVSVQDNFRTSSGKRLKFKDGKPASSVFASVRLYAPSQSINSNDLASLIRKSLYSVQAYKFRVSSNEPLSKNENSLFKKDNTKLSSLEDFTNDAENQNNMR
ncbi:MAG: hypothetical protein VX335_05335, partial [Pseudomonadota bacterium]|nr:hypothetical protein [Pseudomonadota bacterium]